MKQLNRITFACLTGLAAAIPVTSLANNVALGKPVELTGYFGVGSGYFGADNPPYVGVPPLPDANIVTDGLFQGNWTAGVWWDEQFNKKLGLDTPNFVTVDLLGTYQVNGFILGVDQNDRYLVEVRDTVGKWSTAWDAPITGNTRSISLPTPLVATAVRVSGYTLSNVPGTDFAYSVSEIQVSAVPEPSAYAFAFGMVLFGGGVVRRLSKRGTFARAAQN